VSLKSRRNLQGLSGRMLEQKVMPNFIPMIFQQLHL